MPKYLEHLKGLDIEIIVEGFGENVEFILDPLFWQALGKACGWTEKEYMCIEDRILSNEGGQFMGGILKYSY